MKASLGNVDPTETERQRMIVVLDGLRQRFNARGSEFAYPICNEEDGTVELRWPQGPEGSRAWVVAWISGSERALLVWRHPSYRESRDDEYLSTVRRTEER